MVVNLNTFNNKTVYKTIFIMQINLKKMYITLVNHLSNIEATIVIVKLFNVNFCDKVLFAKGQI